MMQSLLAIGYIFLIDSTRMATMRKLNTYFGQLSFSAYLVSDLIYLFLLYVVYAIVANFAIYWLLHLFQDKLSA